MLFCHSKEIKRTAKMLEKIKCLENWKGEVGLVGLGWVGLVGTMDSSETVGTISEQFEKLIHMTFVLVVTACSCRSFSFPTPCHLVQ